MLTSKKTLITLVAALLVTGGSVAGASAAHASTPDVQPGQGATGTGTSVPATTGDSGDGGAAAWEKRFPDGMSVSGAPGTSPSDVVEATPAR